MMRNRVIVSAMAISFLLFLLIMILISTSTITMEWLLKKSLFTTIPLVIGSLLGAIFIIGYFYFIGSGKPRGKYKTFPLYGVAVILEAFGDVLNGKYAFVSMIVSILLLIIAVTIDIRQRVGLYILFKNKSESNE